MKTRIIVGAVLVPVLLLVVFFLPKVATVIAVSLLSAVGTYELLYSTGLVRNIRLVIYSMLFSALIPFWSFLGRPYVFELGGILVFFALMFGENLMASGKIPFSKIAACFVAGLIVPYMFSSLVCIMAQPIGRNLILLPFVLAFCSDTGAYFTGVFFGKHKMTPNISPKKTWEGFAGGIAVAVLGTFIYVLIQDLCFDLQANYLYAVLYGVIGSLTGVFGDLCFSVIKRQTGIKDYGKLFPGHGGVLDRFDSVIVVAPLVECLLIVLPVVH